MKFLEFTSKLDEDAESDVAISNFAVYMYKLTQEFVNSRYFPYTRRESERHPRYYQFSMNDVFEYLDITSEEQFQQDLPEGMSFEDIQILHIFIGTVDAVKDPHGNNVSAGYGKLKVRGQILPALIIYNINPKRPEESDVTRFYGARESFIHEFVHYYDSVRRKSNPPDNNKTYDVKDIVDYYSHPLEYNAFYQQAIDSVTSVLNNELLNDTQKAKIAKTIFGNNFEHFYDFFTNKILKGNITLNPKYEKKRKRRVYKLYVKLIQDYGNYLNVNEGMDSAFFLSKDLNYSAEYPLPYDSVHHQNINTHSENNKKVLKNVTQRTKSKAERKEITKKEKTPTTTK